MTVYDLDHLTLGVRHLYKGAERLRRETGLRSHEGGWLDQMPTANRIVPLPGDAFLNIESVIDPATEDLPPGIGAFAAWFAGTTQRADHWMSWNLRTRTLADLEEVARRFGGKVVTAPGSHRPDGTVATTVMAPGDAALTWARGLPNFYYHADMAAHPARRVPHTHERPLQRIAWLEVGGDPRELARHIGSATYATLPLRFVDAPPGLHGIGLTTRDGEELAVRAPSAAAGLAELAARTA
ncbi:VOC family protein [Streptomyces sp. MAR4 CNY-716]